MLNNDITKTKKTKVLFNIFEIIKLVKIQKEINDKFAGINKNASGITNSKDGIEFLI